MNKSNYMKRLLTFLFVICCVCSLSAKGRSDARDGSVVEGRRKYALTIQENDEENLKEFNRSISNNLNNRAFLATIVSSYRAASHSQLTSLSERVLAAGIKALAEAARNKRPDWEKAVNKESTFVLELPSQREILDFYRERSVIGPLDPSNMLFSGFGCKQVIECEHVDDGKPHKPLVFDLKCKIRTDSVGIARMLNHGKFEIEVDYFYFDPGICNLPNDSLSMNSDKRIGFSFEKRKDLKFKAQIKITSSWMNQAMMVFNDVEIGTFDVTIDIDPQLLNENGAFEYRAERDKSTDKAKKIQITGDSFLVPRSYVGTTDMQNSVDSWGTGQYKIDMKLTQTCKINEAYYTENKKWQRSKWRPEWDLIRKRKSAKFGQQLLSIIGFGYTNGAWVTTLMDPMKTTLVQYENKWINGASSSMQTSTGKSGK